MVDTGTPLSVPVEDLPNSVQESSKLHPEYMDTTESSQCMSPLCPASIVVGDTGSYLAESDPNVGNVSGLSKYEKYNGVPFCHQSTPSEYEPTVEASPEDHNMYPPDIKLAIPLSDDNNGSIPQSGYSAPSESKSDYHLLQELGDILLNLDHSIPRAEELCIEQRSYDSTKPSPQNDRKIDVDWDIRHHPNDEVESTYISSTGKVIPEYGAWGVKTIQHDHSYGSKTEILTNLNMNKVEDAPQENVEQGCLSTGLNDSMKAMGNSAPRSIQHAQDTNDLALEESREQAARVASSEDVTSMSKQTPKSKKDSQDMQRNSLKNKQYLEKELGPIAGVEDIKKLGVDKLRNLVPRLVRYLYYQQDDPAKKGIYDKPSEWPKNKYFGSPCNSGSSGRARKSQVQEMCIELYRKYRLNMAQNSYHSYG